MLRAKPAAQLHNKIKTLKIGKTATVQEISSKAALKMMQACAPSTMCSVLK
jgi:hypothetical protein